MIKFSYYKDLPQEYYDDIHDDYTVKCDMVANEDSSVDDLVDMFKRLVVVAGYMEQSIINVFKYYIEENSDLVVVTPDKVKYVEDEEEDY